MTLDEVWSKIPSFTCKPGCCDCCGPVSFSSAETEKLAEWLGSRGNLLSDFDQKHPGATDCAFLDVIGRCRIYEARPTICRLFGTVATPSMQCPYNCGPAELLTEEDLEAILKQSATT